MPMGEVVFQKGWKRFNDTAIHSFIRNLLVVVVAVMPGRFKQFASVEQSADEQNRLGEWGCNVTFVSKREYSHTRRHVTQTPQY